MPFTLRFDEEAATTIKDLKNGDANATAKLEKVNRALGQFTAESAPPWPEFLRVPELQGRPARRQDLALVCGEQHPRGLADLLALRPR